MTSSEIASSGRTPWIVSAARTPVGRHWGALSGIRPDDLAALVIRAAVDRSGVDDELIEEVQAGIVNASGEAMGNIARFAALLAGLPESTAGLSMNRYCGSGLSAVASLAQAIAFGSLDAGVAVGVEVMSRSTWPIAIPVNQRYPGAAQGRNAMWSGAGGPQHPALETNGTMIDMPPGAQLIADRYRISRQAMDEFALRSHERAAQAWDEGRFADEVVAVKLTGGALAQDETFRRDCTFERLGRLSPYYDGCPDITAGNASPVSDGASALTLVSAALGAQLGLDPLGEIVAAVSAGVAPEEFAIGPVPVVRKLLDRSGLKLGDVGVIEINEAFAAQVIACVTELGIDEDRLNPNGGAIALGHALGNSGSRILVTLVHEMRGRGARYGIATLCVGGGMGVGVLVRNTAL